MSQKTPTIKVTKKEYLENRKLLDSFESEIYDTFSGIKLDTLEEFLEYCSTKLYPKLILAKEYHIAEIKDDFRDIVSDDSRLSVFCNNIINNEKVEHDIELSIGISKFYLYETMSEYKGRKAREMRYKDIIKSRPKKSKKNIEGYISKLTPEELDRVRELVN